jgi:serine/threonine-protein kinase
MESSSIRSYTRISQLAKGGMGTVDLVVLQDHGFQRLFVAKRLHDSMRDDETFRAMFLDEARVAGLIRHANVVSVLDAGEDDAGPYLFMDYVEGVTLGAFIQRHIEADEPIPLQLCVEICSQIAEGLHAAHELVGPDGRRLELVHRDVSPQNVLVGYDGVCRVTDFGIAKALGQSQKTATGVLKGKLGYMSPEQLRFEKLDRRSDLFALGVLLYELVTQRRLYKNRDDEEGPFRILNEPPPDLGVERDGIPPALTELAFELLSKRREARPETAREVARRLDEIRAELNANEGPVELRDSLERHFAESRTAEQTRVRTAIGQALAARSTGTFSKKTHKRYTISIVAVSVAIVFALVAIWRLSRTQAETSVATLPSAPALLVSRQVANSSVAAPPSVHPPALPATAVPPPTRAVAAKPRPRSQPKPEPATTKPSFGRFP